MQTKGKITILTKKEYLHLEEYLKKNCNAKGQKNLQTLKRKYQAKVKELAITGYRIAVISEDNRIAGFLIWLSILVKSYKTCELFAANQNRSFFIIK